MAWGVPIRLGAAAQALGAPKGVDRNPRAQKPNPRPPGLQLHSSKKQMPNANPHKGGPGQNQHAHPGPKSFLEMGPGELRHSALKLAQSQGKAELGPLQGQAREISATEQAAQNRLKALGEAQDRNLGTLGQQAQESAKTAENRAAETALKSATGIETTGQAQAGLLGGYISPEARAELVAQGQQAAAQGRASTSLAQQSGQNQINYLTNLRAAAAAKATEGQSQLASQYARQLATNRQAQEAIPARTAANYQKLALDLPQKQFNEVAAKEALGLKGLSTREKARETRERVAATIRGQNSTAASQAAQRRVTERGQNLQYDIDKLRTEISAGNLSETQRYHRAQEILQKEKASGKAPNPKEGRAYMGKLATAVQLARTKLTTNQGRGNSASQREARELLAKEGASSDVVSAALNLAVYGRLSKTDQAVARAYGLTPNLRPEWFTR